MSDKLIAVSRDLAAVGAPKDGKVTEGQTFRYRSAESVMNLVGPLLAKHGVLLTATYEIGINEAVKVTRRGQGGTTYQVDARYVTAACTITLHADGQQFVSRAHGEGRGTTDKAIPVAQTVAYRVALCSAFCLPYAPRAEELSEESSTPDPVLAKVLAPKPTEQIDAETGEVDAFGLPPVPPTDTYFEDTYKKYKTAGDRKGLLAWMEATTDEGRKIIRGLIAKDKEGNL